MRQTQQASFIRIRQVVSEEMRKQETSKMADGGPVFYGPEFVLILVQLDTEGNILTKFKKSPTSGLGGDNSWTDRRTLENSQSVRKAASRRANNIKKGPQKFVRILHKL